MRKLIPLYDRFDDLQTMLTAFPQIMAAFEDHSNLAEKDTALTPLCILYDSGLLNPDHDIQHTVREELVNGICAFLNTGAEDDLILKLFNNVILELNHSRILSLQNLFKITQKLLSIEELKKFGCYFDLLWRNNKLTENYFNGLLINLHHINYIYITFKETLQKHDIDLPTDWFVVYDSQLTKNDLLIIESIRPYFFRSKNLSSEIIEQFFMEIKNILARGESVSSFLTQYRDSLKEQEQRLNVSSNESSKNQQSKFQRRPDVFQDLCNRKFGNDANTTPANTLAHKRSM